MQQFTTKYFGTLAYEENSVLEFPAGLPGFEDERLFLPIDQPHTEPIIFLQSLNRPEICFITLPVQAVDPLYSLSISQEDLRTLALEEDRQPRIGVEIACLAIISVAENRPPTGNLLAPVVVNLRSRRALQAIQVDSGYSHQHSLEALSGEPSEPAALEEVRCS